jgi:hypothetical protein
MTAPSRLNTSSQLFRSCWQILKRQPKLLLFPLVNAVMVVVIALFFVPWPFLVHQAHSLIAAGQPDHLDEKIAQFNFNSLAVAFYMVALYVTSMFVATFLNVAFYHEIFQALESEMVSIRGGLRFAATRLRSIILWSLLASSVGILLRTIEGRLGLAGRLGAALAGLAWSLAAIFVIPALVRDETAGPLTLLRNSVLTLKKTWGESILGYIGIQGTEFIAFFCLLIPGLFCAYVIAAFFALPMFFVSIPFILLAVIGCAWVTSVANSVYRCALYIYATEGVVPEPFTPAMMDAAWKVKKA